METQVEPAWDPGPGRTARGRWLDWVGRGWLAFLALCVVGALIAGIAWLRWQPLERDRWGLVSVNGNAVTVWATGCSYGLSGPFARVAEHAARVNIDVVFRKQRTPFGMGGCRTFGEQLVIMLKQPLGDRRLTGCRDPDCRALVLPEGL